MNYFLLCDSKPHPGGHHCSTLLSEPGVSRLCVTAGEMEA